MTRFHLSIGFVVFWLGVVPLRSSAMYQPQTNFSVVASQSQGNFRERLESRLVDFAEKAKSSNNRADRYLRETGDLMSVYVLTDLTTFLRFEYIDFSSGYNPQPNNKIGREDIFMLYLLHRPLFVYRPNQLVQENGRVVYDGRLIALDIDGRFNLTVNESGLQEKVDAYLEDYLLLLEKMNLNSMR